MTELFANITTVAGHVATLFIMMGVGFILKKLSKLTEAALGQLTFILLYIVAPCLIINAMQVERGAGALRTMGATAAGCVVFFVIEIAISTLLFRKKPLDTRDVLRFGAMYPNASFMGFPLIRAVLGADAMLAAVSFVIVFGLFSWTHGVIVMGGAKNTSPKNALINPGTIGLAAGLLLFAMNIRLPWPISNAVVFIADVNTPLAMFIIGAQMADADILHLFRYTDLYSACAVRLIIFPALTAVALFFLHLSPLVYCTTVILASAPSAGITSMFALRFNRDTDTAARFVSLSTLLSIITLPVFAAVARQVSGG